MVSELAGTFSRAPTLRNFVELAERSPSEAKGALRRVQQGLEKAGAPSSELTQLARILTAAQSQVASLSRASSLVRAIFPDLASDASTTFADCIAKLTDVASLKWSAGVAPPPVAITGTVTQGAEGELVLKTAGGRALTLTDSPRAGNIEGMFSRWLQGFINPGEGPLTVQGTVSTDGKTLAVEGYAPGTSPDFVFGRVRVFAPMGELTAKLSADDLAQVMSKGRVCVQTMRGEVEVTHPKLKKLLVRLPRLGVILPGAPTVEKGQHVYGQDTEFMYALGGRFRDLVEQPDGVHQATGAFAYSLFEGPVRCEGPTARHRFVHSEGMRAWVGGMFVLDGDDPHFSAAYVSNNHLPRELLKGEYSGDAGVEAQLLAAADAVGSPEGFQRAMGPPGE